MTLRFGAANASSRLSILRQPDGRIDEGRKPRRHQDAPPCDESTVPPGLWVWLEEIEVPDGHHHDSPHERPEPERNTHRGPRHVPGLALSWDGRCRYFGALNSMRALGAEHESVGVTQGEGKMRLHKASEVRKGRLRRLLCASRLREARLQHDDEQPDERGEVSPVHAFE